MNVIFHALIAAAVAHSAAGALPERDAPAIRLGDLRVIVPAFSVAVLSHGVLDGLKHGYPVPVALDILGASAVALSWSLAVRPQLAMLFAAVFAGAFLPDVIDLGPAMVRRLLGLGGTVGSVRHFFPWHWQDGSGSMYPAARHIAFGAGALDAGRNATVSLVNHGIVLFVAGVAIARDLTPFRRKRPPERGHPSR